MSGIWHVSGSRVLLRSPVGLCGVPPGSVAGGVSTDEEGTRIVPPSVETSETRRSFRV